MDKVVNEYDEFLPTHIAIAFYYKHHSRLYFVGLYFEYPGFEQYFTSAVLIVLTLLHVGQCLMKGLRYKAISSKQTSNYRTI